jgi:phosphatidylserine/phosphatidylglycerophosphate/cardiolipin synthase-like enzyme
VGLVQKSPLYALSQRCLRGSSARKLLSLAVSVLQEHKSFFSANQILSPTGFTDGNSVEHVLYNEQGADFIRYLAPMTASLVKNYRNRTVEWFKNEMSTKSAALTEIFTEKEGFPSIYGPERHQAWDLRLKRSGEKNIFGEIYAAIDKAEESIFIDVFFLGGSIGAMLAKKLVDKVQKNKKIWIYLLNDRQNPLRFNEEMEPVYNYLRAYAENFPEDRLVVLTPRIDLKRTAFPDFGEVILKDSVLQAVLSRMQKESLVGQLSFYPKAKSDHSKVFVVDGLNPKTGIAFVGSKNFTDSSGGIAFDDVMKIKGPAVPVILDSYYYDLYEAIRFDLKQEKSYFESLALVHSGGNAALGGAEALERVLRMLLSPVDVLARNRNYEGANKITWPAAGPTKLMIGENNVYGTIRTVLPQVLAAIRSAKKQIIISGQYIYEPSIVRALDAAAKRYPTPVKVYLLLSDMADPLRPHSPFSLIPNISYAEQLIRNSNVEVRWNQIPREDLEALREVQNKFRVNYSPEYHHKTLSVDGVSRHDADMCGGQSAQLVKNLSQEKPPMLISGSANLDVMTMTGGFREFQVTVFDAKASVDHDCYFWQRFTDSNLSRVVRLKEMNLPRELIDRGIDESRFNQIIRDSVLGAYNSMSGYFTE